MKEEKHFLNTDYLVIGSGIAGLRAAIELSKKGQKVVVITKSKIEDSNTYYAQGGAAAVDPERAKEGTDSFESHAEDTKRAGAGLCIDKVVEMFSREAHDGIDFLINNGVKFTKNLEEDKEKGKYPFELHQEGGHKTPRVYCVGDFTGKAIEERLAEIAREDPNITVLENHTAINLITRKWLERDQGKNTQDDVCYGAYALDREGRKVLTIKAGKTFLATGGAGRVFKYTSNPDNATGDGIAMAYRAGADIANMEFFQFHPSVLYEPNLEGETKKRFLITEALRGEKMGGILTLEKDSLVDFVLKYDPRGSHATRDIVAKAIDTEIKKRGKKHVWLNVTTRASGKSKEQIIVNFPKIYEKCLEKGIDISVDPIPVVPAAHYMCGGIVVDINGETSIKDLYAIGETAYTGLMGANRLASNSLSEGALYGRIAVEHGLKTYQQHKFDNVDIPGWYASSKQNVADIATVNQFWDTTREIMTNLCGIDRNEQRLKLAVATLNALADGASDIYRNFYPTHELIELRNLTLVAKIIAESALWRKESRGCHQRNDFPDRNDAIYQRASLVSEIESKARCAYEQIEGGR